MAGTVPARVRWTGRAWSPLRQKRSKRTVCGSQGDGLCLDSYLFISSLPYPVPSMGRTGTHGGHSCLQDMGNWLRPGAQQGHLELRPSRNREELNSKESLPGIEVWLL